MGISKNSDHIQIKIKWQPQSGTSSVLQSPNQDLKDIHVLGTFKIKIENIGVSKISNHIQTNMEMPNCSLKPPASSKGQVKTQRTLVKMESQNFEHGYTKDQCADHIKILIKILNPIQQDQSSDHMKILIKIPNPIQKLFQPKANHCKAELVF